MRFCLLLFWSPAFSGFQEPFPAGGADVWAGADNEVGEQCCTAMFNLLNQCCLPLLFFAGPSTSPSGCPRSMGQIRAQ